MKFEIRELCSYSEEGKIHEYPNRGKCALESVKGSFSPVMIIQKTGKHKGIYLAHHWKREVQHIEFCGESTEVTAEILEMAYVANRHTYT